MGKHGPQSHRTAVKHARDASRLNCRQVGHKQSLSTCYLLVVGFPFWNLLSCEVLQSHLVFFVSHQKEQNEILQQYIFLCSFVLQVLKVQMLWAHDIDSLDFSKNELFMIHGYEEISLSFVFDLILLLFMLIFLDCMSKDLILS